MTETNQPEKRFSAGAISATVWLNAGNYNGQQTTYRTVSFQRRYKDKSGEWKSASSLGVNDLSRAIHVLQKAQNYLFEKGTEVNGVQPTVTVEAVQ